jgi:hypothetical protein
MERANRIIPIGNQSLRTQPIDIQAFHDRDYLQRLLRVRKLTSLESGSVDTIKGRWRTAMAQAQIAGVDLEQIGQPGMLFEEGGQAGKAAQGDARCHTVDGDFKVGVRFEIGMMIVDVGNVQFRPGGAGCGRHGWRLTGGQRQRLGEQAAGQQTEGEGSRHGFLPG